MAIEKNVISVPRNLAWFFFFVAEQFGGGISHGIILLYLAFHISSTVRHTDTSCHFIDVAL
jgi:hypothetical protein